MDRWQVYLIAKACWASPFPIPWNGVAVPCPPFKIGYSVNPAGRLAQLRLGVPFNLILLGAIPGFPDEAEAAAAESIAKMETARLAEQKRGEWFHGDQSILGAVWDAVFAPKGGVLLNEAMVVDLDRAPLLPLPRNKG